jgi:hypothetical protein
MNKAEMHYLMCQFEHCDRAYCVSRREYEQRLLCAEGERDAYRETLTRISKLEKTIHYDWASRQAESILGRYKEKP